MASMHYAGIGSRRTPEPILDLMGRVAGRLERLGYTLRSGGAQGADRAFELGCEKKIIFYQDHARCSGGALLDHQDSSTYEVQYSGSDIEFMELFVQRHHPVPMALRGAARKLMRRNALQVSRYSRPRLELPWVDFVLCWTPDGSSDGASRAAGGTGQALRIAHHHGIPVFNLEPDPAGCLDRLKGHLVSTGVIS